MARRLAVKTDGIFNIKCSATTTTDLVNTPAVESVALSYSTGKVSQTITFNPNPLPDKTYGNSPFTVAATASSNLVVTFTVSGACINSGTNGATVTLTGAGSCTVTAHQSGNTTYDPAPDVPRTFNIAKANQTITFNPNPLPNKLVSDPPFTVVATATSSLPVTFTVSGTCIITDTTVTLTGVGSCTVTAHQSGGANYNAAPDLPRTFSITTGNQTITFNPNPLPNKTYGEPPFTVVATATSSLPVTFTVSGMCTNSGTYGDTVTVTGVGSCTVTAHQSGDANYNAAPDVPRTFSIAKANQTIAFAALPDKVLSDPPFTVVATATSSLPVTFTVSGACTNSGTNGATVTVTGVGSCTVTAHQAGSANYNAAPDVPQTFSIAKANQTITFAALPDKAYADPPFTVVATSTSSLPVTFTVSGACTNSGTYGDTVTATGVGSCTVTAHQSGNATYDPAPDVPQTFSIVKADQTIAFAALPNKVLSDPPFTVVATATSSLPVTFTVSGACTNSGTNGATVTVSGVGSCTVTAHQAGSANYNAAPDVPRTFTIAAAGQTITFNPLGNRTYGDPSFAVSATASSELPVTFTVSGGVCSITGATVSLTGAGTCTVTAHQAGNIFYGAAPDVPQTFSIVKANQTIAFAALPDRVVGAPPFTVTASASSGLTVTLYRDRAVQRCWQYGDLDRRHRDLHGDGASIREQQLQCRARCAAEFPDRVQGLSALHYGGRLLAQTEADEPAQLGRGLWYWLPAWIL